MKYQRELLNNSRTEFDRQKALFHKEVISKSDYEKAKYTFEKAKLSYDQLVSSQLSAWQNNLSQLNEQLIQLQQTLVTLKKEREKYTVLAPFSGHIQQLLPLKKGSVVLANQKICMISPTDDLLVETYISPSDIGFIQKNQTVKFRIDAFNSNRWGMAEGSVKELANDVTIEGNQVLGFRALCKINKLELNYKDKTAKLKKGMTLTANFVLARRTLAQLLFDDISDWLNPSISNNIASNE